MKPDPPSLVDTHCHLTDPRFSEDLERVLEDAAKAGVAAVVVVGDALDSSREALQIAQKHSLPRLYATAGIHPHNAESWSVRTAEKLARFCEDARSAEPGGVVAIGETGLDFYYDNAPRPKQIESFVGHIKLAHDLRLPLVLHCRDAYNPFIELLGEHEAARTGGVVHCFSGTPEEGIRLAKMGFYLGIGGALTFPRNEALRETVCAVPLEALLLETDAPYLAPVPCRGKRNEPAWMRRTAERLAELLSLPLEKVAEQTTLNAIRLFGISAF